VCEPRPLGLSQDPRSDQSAPNIRVHLRSSAANISFLLRGGAAQHAMALRAAVRPPCRVVWVDVAQAPFCRPHQPSCLSAAGKQTRKCNRKQRKQRKGGLHRRRLGMNPRTVRRTPFAFFALFAVESFCWLRGGVTRKAMALRAPVHRPRPELYGSMSLTPRFAPRAYVSSPASPCPYSVRSAASTSCCAAYAA